MDSTTAVFMVRDTAFGGDFTTKAVICVITVALVVWDGVRHRRRDYLWVLLTGTVLWSLVELSLQLRGQRVMPDRLLLGEQLPLAWSAVIQGVSEGAFVAVLGLFAADRIRNRDTRSRAVVGYGLLLLIMALLMVLGSAARPPADVGSRREMLLLPGLITLAVVAAFDVWFWLRRPDHRMRSLGMTAAMLAFATVWTAVSVATGGRWVEVLSGSGFSAAPAGLGAAALAFDVVVEIALAYVPFFAIPALLGLIPPSAPVRRSLRRTAPQRPRPGPPAPAA